MTAVDRELAAVLITLAPLGDRGLAYVDTVRREFRSDAALDVPWSTGERVLILVARSLWRGTDVDVDLSYLAGMSAPFFLAVMNGIAAYRGSDFTTDWSTALSDVTA
jgi:hypothetical protein